VIEGYNVNTNQAYLISDPKTGQPIMLSTSADQDCLYVMDGISNPVGLITDFALSSYTYTFEEIAVAGVLPQHPAVSRIAPSRARRARPTWCRNRYQH